MNLKEFFESEYKGADSLRDNVIIPIFGSQNFEDKYDAPVLDYEPQLKESALRHGIAQILDVGTVTIRNTSPIEVLDVTVTGKDTLRTGRVGLTRVITNHLLQTYQSALIAFHYQDSPAEWRISFCHKGTSNSDQTDARRLTFLLGKGQGCRTATENFCKLSEKCADGSLEAEDVIQAFSVETLTKEFYNDLYEWFCWAVDPSTGVTFPNDTETPEDDREGLETKIIRLITRLMFVWFIKQKDLVPTKIFDEMEIRKILKDFDPLSLTDGNYYNAILQNLFFATLNRAIVDDDGKRRGFAKEEKQRDIRTLYRYAEMFSVSEDEVVELFAQVPFLNGGLFECQDKIFKQDNVEKSRFPDGFSRNDARFANGRYKYRAVVPNALFFHPDKGLFSILGRYNFTIEENTPDDQKVALDPELLGKVFENLLGTYNPETRETARNQSGSFYTPREIVNYMVDESIKAYVGDSPLLANLLAKPQFSPIEDDPANMDGYAALAAKLRKIKVIDPACGSGAFPMGVMMRMVDILSRIEPEADPYKRKIEVIENCIYGSDIQCIATQITKLRFFISLVCDCEKDSSKPNFGIPTLPNLETKFVAADTLTGLRKNETLFSSAGNLNTLKKELNDIRHAHFLARSAKEKQALRKQDKEKREELTQLLQNESSALYNQDDAIKIAAWNPYDQNAVAEFFDPEWMFGVGDGFDIVIGNPPYVQLQNGGGKLAKAYESAGYETFDRRGDIYSLFYERGWQLLKDGGHLCFITSNKWMRAGYGEKTRLFFASRTNPLLLIDFAGVKVFESATVDTNILLFAKAPNQGRTLCAVASKADKCGVINMSLFARRAAAECAFAGPDAWVVLSPLEQAIRRKVEAAGTPLRDWDVQINYGIKTGYNDAFIVTTGRRDEILAACRTEAERERTAALIRPILRGRDIRRYGYQWAGLWIIATFPSLHYDIEDYPAVKDYLLSFGMERLEQTGKEHIVDGVRVRARKKTCNKWFETQDSISYWGDFARPKIVYPDIMRLPKSVSDLSNYPYICIDDKNYIPEATVFLITGRDIDRICAFLCSEVGFFAFVKYYSGPAFDDTGFRFKKQYLLNLPIPNFMIDIDGNYERKLVIELGLTEEEINVINEFKASLIGAKEK